MKRHVAATTLALVLGLTACQQTRLETRTFELQHIRAEEAADAIEPYVFSDREGAPGRISLFSDGLTVRETEDNLNRIQRVLERLDRPRPGVRLRFQVIQADGGDSDPRIEHVESLLRDLFRYEGYRLLEEAQLMAGERSHSEQMLDLDGQPARLVAEVHRIRTGGEGGTVTLLVSLERGTGRGSPDLISTTVTLRLGQTAVLGSSRPGADREAVILTVRPELADAAPVNPPRRDGG